jgi:hypothetical protein
MISQGSTTSVEFIKETVIGQTPTTPQTSLIPYIDFKMELDKDVFTDPSRTSDNQARFLSGGAFRTSGSLDVAYSIGQFDDFVLAGIMGSAWATNVAKLGNTKTGFTFSEWDATNSIARTFTGVEIGSVGLTIPPNDVAKISFNMLGRNMTLGATQLDSTPTAILAGKNPMTHVNGFMKIDNVTAYVTGIKLDINNNISQLNVLGSNAAYGTYLGMKTVSGSLTIVYEDNTFYNKFINNASAVLEFQIGDGTSTHTWKLPNVKLSKVAGSTDAGVRLLTCDFVGLYDATLGSILSVTRSGV